MSSITMSTSFERTSSKASSVSLALPPVIVFARARSLSATCVIWIARPARRWISSALRFRTSHVPPPTVPMPSSPTRMGCISGGGFFGAQQPVLAEHVADAARRLAQAMLVLDQRDPHVVVAVVAEAYAGGDGDLRLLQQPLGEFDRAEPG